MNNKAKKAEVNGKISNFTDDFSFLTLKEKHGILKNAKCLLKLQRENTVFQDDSCSYKK